MDTGLSLLFGVPHGSDQNSSTVNVLKFLTPKFLTKWLMQTVQTQIRMLLIVYTVCHSIKGLKKQLHKKHNLDRKSIEKVFQILCILKIYLSLKGVTVMVCER